LAFVCKKENQPAADGALHLIARAAEGSARDALSLLDQAFAHAGGAKIEEEPVRAMLGIADRSRGLSLFEMIMRGAIGDALGEFRGQYDSGADPLAILQDLSQICHEVTRTKVADGAASGALPEEAKRMGDLAQNLTVPQLARTWQLLLKALAEVQAAPDAAAATEMALIRIAYAAELPPTDQLVRGLGTAQSSAPAPAARGSAAAPPPSPPPLRMTTSAGSGRETASAARSEPTTATAPRPVVAQATAPAAAKIELRDYNAIVALARENREARLLFALENWVHLVRFERGRLEIRLEPGANTAFPGELSDKLTKLSGERWVVSVSSAEGAPTLVQQRQAEDQARRLSASNDPLMKAAMAVFPGAKIVAVRDRDAFDVGEDDGAAAETSEDS
jgi:DNA polymerase-3 subunit gamma/tau